MNIPAILHQTWKDDNIPDHLLAYVASWKNLHPQWEYRLWTDEMNRQFILDHYPGFLPVYDWYPSPIQRVDAVRYFILLKMGGLFVDLDFECLQNIEPLLEQAEFVAGLEPEAHAIAHRKPFIISNAFMAAVPGIDFLQQVCTVLRRNDYYRYRSEPGFNAVLDCAGPFMLSRIYDQYPHKETIKIAAAAQLYPLVKDEATGRPVESTPGSGAFAIHHYWGSWWQS